MWNIIAAVIVGMADGMTKDDEDADRFTASIMISAYIVGIAVGFVFSCIVWALVYATA